MVGLLEGMVVLLGIGLGKGTDRVSARLRCIHR